MDNNPNPRTASAQELANQMNVTELEPRKENLWSGGRDDTSIEHATPNTGRE